MYRLPTSIYVADKEYKIRDNGDFRIVLECFNALQDIGLSKEERIYSSLIIFLDGMNSIENLLKLPDIIKAYEEMCKFFNCGQQEVSNNSPNYRLIDWEIDEPLICSAVNNVAGTEIRLAPYIHWWTFMGYYMAVGKSSLSTVVGIRHKIATHKKLEDYEKTFMRDNPQYFTVDTRSLEQIEIDEEIKSMWNS